MRDTNERAVRAMREFLEALGINLAAHGMEKTPERVANMYASLFDGLGCDTKDLWGELFHTGSAGLVAVRHIPFYSMCEHHLVPFFGEVNIVYWPHDGQVAGFGKFVKLVECLAHQPQLQERLTAQIAHAVEEDLGARGVLTVVTAQQLCMTMRDSRAHGTQTVTSEYTGIFAENHGLCQQAWSLLGGAGNDSNA